MYNHAISKKMIWYNLSDIHAHTHTHIYIYIIYSYVCVAIISCLSKHSTTPLVTPPPKWKPLFSIPAIYRPELKWTRWLVCTGCNGANWNKQGSIADLAATSLKKKIPPMVKHGFVGSCSPGGSPSRNSLSQLGDITSRWGCVHN